MESTALEHGHSTPRLVTKQSYARPLSLHFVVKESSYNKDQKIFDREKNDYYRLAVEFARRCGAKKLVINHFSQRYRSEKDEKYNHEESVTDRILLTQG